MPEEILFNDFSAGWIPSDDPISGRKNGLSNMDNLCLDTTGALTNISRFGQITSGAGIPGAIDLDSSANGLYQAIPGQGIYRDVTKISGAGTVSSYKTAFGAAFNYELIASDAIRLKDDGTTTSNLGITGAPTPTVAISSPNYCDPITPSGSYTAYTDTGSSSTATPTVNYTATTPGFCGIETSSALGFSDWTTLNMGASPALPQSDTDIITVSLQAVSGTLANITAIHFLITCGAAPFFVATKSLSILFDNIYTVTFYRSDFSGVYQPNWAYVDKGVFNIQLDVSGPTNVIIGGTNIPVVDAAVTTYTTHYTFYNGVAINGASYQYIEIGVNNNGSYIATSGYVPSSISAGIYTTQVVNFSVGVTHFADTQVTNIWLFRRGGNLGQFYRVAVLSNTDQTYIDNLSDESALTLGITFNTNLISVDSTSITDPIYSIVGPIESRWFYFTANFMYPSDINNPDVVNPSLGVRTAGGQERFLFAQKVAEGIVLVATSKDFYILSGTFATLADGSIDLYYRSLVCSHPAISPDSTYHDQAIYYTASDGLRAVSINGQSELLTFPSLNTLYLGDTNQYGYTVVNLSYNTGSNPLRIPIVIQNNKLYIALPGSNRIDTYDLARENWRTVIPENAPLIIAMCIGINGHVIVSAAATAFYWTLEDPFYGSTSNFVYTLRTPFGKVPIFTRNDYYTLKIKGQFTAAAIGVEFDDGTSLAGTFTCLNEININLTDSVTNKAPIRKAARVYISGTSQGVSNQIIIRSISFVVDPRPMQVTQMLIRPDNFESSSNKRMRVWPIVVDTLGSDVHVYGLTTGGEALLATINSTDKSTFSIFYTTDVFAVDYGLRIVGPNPFEFYGLVQPTIVQTLPQGNEYDQVGPVEWRWSKIQMFIVRIFTFTGGSLPYMLYMDEVLIDSGSINLAAGIEADYEVMVSKGTQGTVLRLVFGPTAFEFMRYYVKFKVTPSGNNTTDSTSWVTVPGKGANI